MTPWSVLRLVMIAGLIGWAIGHDFTPPKTELRDWTPAEIELLVKAVGAKYGGVCL